MHMCLHHCSFSCRDLFNIRLMSWCQNTVPIETFLCHLDVNAQCKLGCLSLLLQVQPPIKAFPTTAKITAIGSPIKDPYPLLFRLFAVRWVHSDMTEKRTELTCRVMTVLWWCSVLRLVPSCYFPYRCNGVWKGKDKIYVIKFFFLILPAKLCVHTRSFPWNTLHLLAKRLGTTLLFDWCNRFYQCYAIFINVQWFITFVWNWLTLYVFQNNYFTI
jgi:hypothetical protein